MGFRNVEGGFKVHEAVFLIDKAKTWFQQALSDKGIQLKLNYSIDNIDTHQPITNRNQWTYIRLRHQLHLQSGP